MRVSGATAGDDDPRCYDLTRFETHQAQRPWRLAAVVALEVVTLAEELPEAAAALVDWLEEQDRTRANQVGALVAVGRLGGRGAAVAAELARAAVAVGEKAVANLSTAAAGQPSLNT